jgi:flagellar biogenesis protein FliO
MTNTPANYQEEILKNLRTIKKFVILIFVILFLFFIVYVVLPLVTVFMLSKSMKGNLIQHPAGFQFNK